MTGTATVDERLLDAVQRYWGYASFRPLQLEAMRAVAGGRDSLVVLPTGGGKSLCFQAPALLLPGMAVVVSPLISLMKDQVDALVANGVAAACIHSMLKKDERARIDRRIRDGELALLYVSPERLAQPAFIDYLRRSLVSFVVVDEAHCISHWGHDFRPEYRELRGLRQFFPEAPIHAYTATATPHVRQDIRSELCLREPVELVGSFDRPNLVYHVARRTDALTQIRVVVDRYRGDSGIIYAITRKEVENLCAALRAAGYRALPYHAGLSDEDRHRNQEAFSEENADIIVATVAFGMGIDKSNVRYVIHAGMPKSIEHYQQESGRAGRDGLEAECWLLYSYADFMCWKNMLSKSEGEAAEIALQKLRQMLDYCTRAACKHNALLAYFGEACTNSNCGACDYCLTQRGPSPEAVGIAQTILKCVAEIGDFAGCKYTTEILCGSKEDRVTAKGHDRLKTFGALSRHKWTMVRQWIEQLVEQGYLVKRGQYAVLAITEKGSALRKGAGAPILELPAEGPARRGARGAGRPAEQRMENNDTVDAPLFEKLRALRRAKAAEFGVYPFVIFSDASLRQMARLKPTTPGEFARIPGVGRRKLEALGDVFIELIRRHIENGPGKGEQTTTQPVQARAVKRGELVRRAVELSSKGHRMEEVAAMIGRSLATVEGYLEDHLKEKGAQHPGPWVSDAVFQRVREAFARTGDGRLKPVFEMLGGEISYGEIRLCRVCLANAGRLPETGRGDMA